jgi:hypothetical protein
MKTKTTPIREGDKFRSTDGEIWTVLDNMGFGRGYWTHSADRKMQTVFKYEELQNMKRVS